VAINTGVIKMVNYIEKVGLLLNMQMEIKGGISMVNYIERMDLLLNG
jgi:hypothetical protein